VLIHSFIESLSTMSDVLDPELRESLRRSWHRLRREIRVEWDALAPMRRAAMTQRRVEAEKKQAASSGAAAAGDATRAPRVPDGVGRRPKTKKQTTMEPDLLPYLLDGSLCAGNELRMRYRQKDYTMMVNVDGSILYKLERFKRCMDVCLYIMRTEHGVQRRTAHGWNMLQYKRRSDGQWRVLHTLRPQGVRMESS
jgi:hypothetical protein